MLPNFSTDAITVDHPENREPLVILDRGFLYVRSLNRWFRTHPDFAER